MNISNRHKIIILKDRSEINLVFKKGRKVATRFGPVFLYNARDDQNYKKVAILLKKSIGTAVKRNYVKRIIRTFIRENRSFFEENNRIIFIYSSKEPVNYKLLKQEYRRTLQR